ncbi:MULTISPECIES: 6-phospho-beta-glucosidase [Peribacillus]|uniref:6-phospho-beta-glucosidase n=1 Tax=Peribacillus simplex TaxID=1478 RepID=A0A109MW02_9BACI|nr:6-phospho-beta-glucosidase [Peribacillus simplex]KWW16601.1 6-phospho-beta-glucosidase [Peribacillus simplex]
MKQGIKIATIGGGSSYTPELIEGFIKRHNELPVTEIWLADIEEGKAKLEIVGNLAKRMVEKAGVAIEIHLTLDRKEALKDADFVTTQMRVGMLDARMKDEAIPLKYGVIGQETNGPGGLFKGMRTIPVILEICKEMECLCPDAWLINFTNPAGMVTEAVLRYSNIKKVVGLCNGPIGTTKGLAKMLEVDSERVYVEYAGLNHMVFGLHAYVDGEEVTKEVMSMLGGREKDGITPKNIAALSWEPDFIERLGVVPSGYHRYYYQTDKMLRQLLDDAKHEGTRAEVVRKLESELFELYKDESLAVKPKQLEGRGGAYYSEAAVQLIHSIHTDKRDIQTVNVRNNGALSSIPDESAVEINCVITKHGPVPLTVGDLPIQVRGLVQQIKSFERIACEAAITGNYQTALLAMTINPLVPSDTVAKQILDEMLEAHKQFLPQFFQRESITKA